MYGMTPVGVFFIAILPPVINDQALCQQPQHDPKQPHKNTKAPGRHEATRTHEITHSFMYRLISHS